MNDEKGMLKGWGYQFLFMGAIRSRKAFVNVLWSGLRMLKGWAY